MNTNQQCECTIYRPTCLKFSTNQQLDITLHCTGWIHKFIFMIIPSYSVIKLKDCILQNCLRFTSLADFVACLSNLIASDLQCQTCRTDNKDSSSNSFPQPEDFKEATGRGRTNLSLLTTLWMYQFATVGCSINLFQDIVKFGRGDFY